MQQSTKLNSFNPRYLNSSTTFFKPAFGAQASQFSFGKPATASTGFNAPQQAGAFTLGGQTAATGTQEWPRFFRAFY